jgi:hypothetical protein
LLANESSVEEVVLKHILEQKLESKDISTGPVETAGGDFIMARSGNYFWFLNNNATDLNLF